MDAPPAVRTSAASGGANLVTSIHPTVTVVNPNGPVAVMLAAHPRASRVPATSPGVWHIAYDQPAQLAATVTNLHRSGATFLSTGLPTSPADIAGRCLASTTSPEPVDA